MHVSILIVLLSTCFSGFVLATYSYKQYLRLWGMPGVPSPRKQPTPRKRQLAYRTLAEFAIFGGSIAIMLLLGPWQL